MRNTNQLNVLPFSKKQELNTLVENRRAYTMSSFELSIFETYETSSLVPLQFAELVIINMIRGKKVMHLQQRPSFDYYPGATLLLPEGTRMQIDFPDANIDAPTQCTAITVDADKIVEVVNYLNEFYPQTERAMRWSFQLDKFHFSNNEELTRLINRLFQISLSGDQHKDALADLVLKELMIRIMQMQGLLVLSESAERNSSIFTALRHYIKENIAEKLSIDQLSRQAGMSKSTLSRAFRERFNVSPMEFVIRERLAYAKKLLRATKSVKEACFSSGFSDVNYFIRLFKQREGVTPGQYIARIGY
ncbi:AraC family transcriptional regulator [Sphingobacterium allocomposti]|uniref:AraC family transcriptional regulator n=1 Tax=Sphingobacterium allocomposti TaxID=415956 RepID=A0A5S5DK57_9SPHI|nr:AraC family transcriptional regulator [Sphingobacterium composti Yoo et al. 2007 non Ten et al. 2007]TYP96301.1 AraC family transcriptional regulator [Sphingobacterium composti Yoo et al. 2007 non Ten et al. 2007]HLS94013.1 AraC family transcriptional regulator [Sphingobacterium sp.]